MTALEKLIQLRREIDAQAILDSPPPDAFAIYQAQIDRRPLRRLMRWLAGAQRLPERPTDHGEV